MTEPTFYYCDKHLNVYNTHCVSCVGDNYCHRHKYVHKGRCPGCVFETRGKEKLLSEPIDSKKEYNSVYVCRHCDRTYSTHVYACKNCGCLTLDMFSYQEGDGAFILQVSRGD